MLNLVTLSDTIKHIILSPTMLIASLLSNCLCIEMNLMTATNTVAKVIMKNDCMIIVM
jgi:hypothetical protein